MTKLTWSRLNLRSSFSDANYKTQIFTWKYCSETIKIEAIFKKAGYTLWERKVARLWNGGFMPCGKVVCSLVRSYVAEDPREIITKIV
uniref:Uncharacterized protein n=1 Tax=Meloidogyne incognita TaxID=6306 RepID=A0A914LNE9_MELIC